MILLKPLKWLKLRGDSVKIERINTDLKREISKILANDVQDKNVGFVTVIDVETSNDLSLAKVYVTVLNDEKKEQVMKALSKAKGFVRSQLFSRVELRKIPDLRFVYDESIGRAYRIEELIKEVDENV